MSRSYGYPTYVPVARRRARARKKIDRLRKKGAKIKPVEISGRTIARTFWGKAWCRHLEKFSDYSNRLPRGRSYVRNGSVCHLKISVGTISALVAGKALYNVKVTIRKLRKEEWNRLKSRCEGRIASLLELLKGRLSEEVMAVVTDRDHGLFPLPWEIDLDCDCPDWAVMCKHVAAVLYGVGARLDEEPELLFRLRGVDHRELIASETELMTAVTTGADGGCRKIAAGDLENVFGIEMTEEKPAAGKKRPPGRSRRKKKTGTGSRTKPARKKAKPAAGKNRRKTARKELSPAAFETFSSTGKKLTGIGIRKARTVMGLSQKQFASLVGVSAASISNWENQKKALHLSARSRQALTSVLTAQLDKTRG